MTGLMLGRMRVRRIGFGAMRLLDRNAQGVGLLRAAVARGVDHIDTAQYYGPGTVNRLIRKALYPYPEELAIVTKVGARRDALGRFRLFNEPRELRQGIEENLKTLGVGQLPAVNLRLVDGAPVDAFFDAQVAAMAQARDDGLLGGVGLSNIGLGHLRRALQTTDVVCVQNAFSLANRSSLDVLRECNARGIAFVPFGSLGSGMIRGNPVLTDARVLGIASEVGASAAQVALAWALQLSPSILLIPGTTSTEHLLENLAAAEVRLTDQAMRTLGRLDDS
jgi:pyridoxine 4-dehydrogenase